MEKIVLKLKVGDQLRRVNLEERPVAIGEVQRILAQLFPSLLSYSLFYQDEEGDRIIVETDLELSEALQVALLSNPKIPVIRLEVEECESKPNVAPSPQPQAEPKEEEKKEEQKEEKKKGDEGESAREKKRSLFGLVPKAFFLHPFAKRCAEMVSKKAETVHGNAFLGPFVASWGALGDGHSFIKKLAQSVIDGVDCEIPEHVANHPFFSERCEWLQKNQAEILDKFDKMEAGLKKLKEKKNASFLPPDAQMMLLWACNGDVDSFLSHMGGGAGPNINIQAPGFSYAHSSCASPSQASFSFSFGDGSMGSSSFSSSSSTTSSSSAHAHCSANVKINVNGKDVVDVEGMSVAALKQFLKEKNISFAGVFEKEELKSLVRDSVSPPPPSSSSSEEEEEEEKSLPKEEDSPKEEEIHDKKADQPQPPPVEVKQPSKREEAIGSLLVLGFPRSEIVAALNATNDDVNLAADCLLGQ